MRFARLAAIAVFVVAVPVFLITTNVRWVINAPVLYSYGFDKYDIPLYTGIERDELLSAGRQIRDYFNNDEKDLIISTVQRGIAIPSLFNSREITHMRDVKGLVQGVYDVQLITGLYLVAFAVVGFIATRRRFLPQLARLLGMGGGLTLGLVVAVGLGALVGFERLFLAFHEISFSNDFWQLDPRTDALIAMFPEGFFLDATLWIVGSTVLEAAILAAVPVALRLWRPWRILRPSQTVQATAQEPGA